MSGIPAGAVTVPSIAFLPLNDTFKPKIIALNQRVKIGRHTSVKTVPNDRNGFFDTKVLSRQHAEIWEDAGKIWIKDVKSSNGTFINGVRLSLEGIESEPHPLRTDDHVEFGIDIIGEDNRTVLHHKVSSRITCVLNQEDAMSIAHPSHPHNALQHSQAGVPVGSSGVPQNGQVNAGSYAFRRPNGQQAPSQQTLALGGMGAPGGSVSGRRTGGPSFEHILSRLQNELQRSRETSSELTTLAGTMGDIQDSLSNAIPPTTLTHLPPARTLSNGSDSGVGAPNPTAAGAGSNFSRDTAKDTEFAALSAKVDEMRQYADAVRDVVTSHAEVRRELAVLKQQVALQQSAPRPLEDTDMMNGHTLHQVEKLREGERAGAVSPVARLLEREGYEDDDNDDARSIATVLPTSSETQSRPALSNSEEDASNATERTLSWTRDQDLVTADDGWPDEPPPLASVPADIAGATRGDIDPEPVQETTSEPPLLSTGNGSPLTTSPPGDGSNSPRELGQSAIIPGTGLSLRRRGTVKPRARIQIKKERLNGTSPKDLSPKDEAAEFAPLEFSPPRPISESFVLKDRSASQNHQVFKELQDARDIIQHQTSTTRDALSRLEERLATLEATSVSTVSPSKQAPFELSPELDDLIGRAVTSRVIDAVPSWDTDSASLAEQIRPLVVRIVQEVGVQNGSRTEAPVPTLEDIETIVQTAFERHGVPEVAAHREELQTHGALLAQLLQEREQWQQERTEMQDALRELKAVREHLELSNALKKSIGANNKLVINGMREDSDQETSLIASPSKLASVTGSIFRQRFVPSNPSGASPATGLVTPPIVVLSSSQRTLTALLLAVCAVLLQPLAGSGVVALALIAIAWWAVVRSAPAQVQW